MMVSLPAKWLRKNELGKGDEVDIIEREKDLIVGGEIENRKKETEINLSSLTESSIRTILTNSYRLGYDKIKINFKDKKAVETLINTIDSDLIGFELTKKENDHCIVENITEPSKEQFDNIFSKIFLNIDDLIEISEDFLKGESRNFVVVERKIKQFDNFCKRVITKNGLDEGQLRWAFHSELIHAQRELFHMLKYLDKNKIKASQEVLDLLDDCKKVFEILKKSYNGKDIQGLEKIHDLEKEIVYKKGYLMLKNVKNDERIVVHHIINSVRGFYLASSPLIGLFI